MHMKSFAVAALTILALTGCSTRERPTMATPASVAATSQSTANTSPLKAASEADTKPKTFSSFDRAAGAPNEIGGRMILFESADLPQVLELYQLLSGRSLIHSPRVPNNVKITFRNNSPLRRVEALQALDTVLAAQGIVMVYSGTQYVKACAAAEAPTEVPPALDVPWRELPDSMSFLSYTVQLKNIDPSSAISALQPFARLPNSIIGNRQSNLLILRDYSSNVRRMMEILEQLETSFVPAPPQRPNK
jgi:type II secretory pathway component GspD/PulD (secretin)